MLQPKIDNSIQHAAGQPARAGGERVHETRRRHKSRGQAIVEFAVLLPMLVLILALAADFGRAFTAYIAISSAAREGAASGMQTGDMSNIEAAVQAEIGSGGSIWGTNVEVFPSIVNDDGQGYEQVVVTVRYAFSPLIPIPPIPNTVSMERTVKMRVLN